MPATDAQLNEIDLVETAWTYVDAWYMTDGHVLICGEIPPPSLQVAMWRVSPEGERTRITDALNMSHWLIDAEKTGSKIREPFARC